ncbi:MAG TPA: SRPBCC family protein [Longimicrobiales bacterium]|nr:SRPBCC family protein [Longimicrobiales bacterium]
MASTYPLVSDEQARTWEADGTDHVNVGGRERVVSLLGGAVLTVYGLRRRGGIGTVAAAAGTMLIERGLTGHCRGYSAMNISTEHGRLHSADPHADPETAMPVRRAVTVMRPRSECYQAWRDLASLPSFMDYLESVEVMDQTRSRWRAKGPAGKSIEWVSVIVSDVPDRSIAWESVDPADVPNRGRVDFIDAPGDRGTEVHVSLEWDPPGGAVARVVGMMFGRDPQHEVNNALRRFRQIMETGTVPTVEGQPTGRGRGETIQRLQ